MKRAVPLFPLNTVLFPGAVLPLKIFEERYKAMVGECLEGGHPFGVCLIMDGPEVGGIAQPYPVGCLADIEKIKRRPGGKLDLVVRGTDRFRVVKELQRQPYWRAEIETLEDADAGIEIGGSGKETSAVAANSRRLREGMAHYANVFMLITSKQLEYERKFEDACALSWFVADLLQGDNGGKQKLLQSESTAARLEMEVALLQAEVDRLKKLWQLYKYSSN
jgi:Lon protease-like protein